MALYSLSFLVLLGCVRGLISWRGAVYVMMVIAAVQDPLRKLVPGTPGWMVLSTAPVLAVAAFQMMLTQPNWWQEFRAIHGGVARAMGWFGLACVVPALISGTYGPGSWMLTILGIASYGFLLLAFVMGFHLPISIQSLRRVLGFYCLVSTPMLTGSFIEYYGLANGNPLIGTEQLGIKWIRYSGSYVVDLIAGFYRSPDVMGWHASATVMFSMILAMTFRGGRRWGWVMVGAIAAGALLLCGRRKMVFMVPLFFGIIISINWALARRRSQAWLISILVIVFGLLTMFGERLEEDSKQIRYYSDQAMDSFDQLERHAVDSVLSTVEAYGIFGAGLGVATPGSHHIDVARPRVWQESGPSRVMVELGVPGFVALIWIFASVISSAWRVVKLHLKGGSPYSLYVVGLFACFLVNVASLLVSGQILADPFIATFVGLTVGIVLAFGRLAPQPSYPPPWAMSALGSAGRVSPVGRQVKAGQG